ncbi:hypothetical protein Pfo_024211, partial [Paulownia fortunei]
MTADAIPPSYWLNWRFLLCAIWILVAMVFAALLIWRYEGHSKSRNRPSEDQQEAAGCLYEDEVWGTCLKSIHPVWLLAYRIVAFSALLALLLADIIIHSGGKYYFYTDYLFSHSFLVKQVDIYFGHRLFWVEPERVCCICADADSGSYVPPTLGENAEMPSQTGSLNHYDEHNCRTAASVWGYALQIVFQMCAGAVALTDSVFWLIIYPFLTPKDYRLSFLVVCMHSANAVLLLGDAILNCLRFPFFRMAYFVLWTCIYVICQWIIHACVSIRYVLSSRAAAFSMFWDLYPHIQDKAMLFIKI